MSRPPINDNLDNETHAILSRIQYIRDMLQDSDGGLEDNMSNGPTEEYQEFMLNYIETIKKQIEENHEEYEQLFHLKSILEQNIEKLSDSLNVARKQIERQNIKLSSMSKAKSDFENREKEYELNIRDYQSQIREFKKNFQELESRISEITTKNSELAQEVAELTTDNANLQHEKDQLEKDYFNLNEKTIGLEQALTTKQEEYNRIYDRIQALESQIDTNDDNTDNLLQENLDLGEGIIEMEKSMKYMRDAIYKFMDFIRPDLPHKSIFKILFCLIENKRVKVKEFQTLTNITVQKSYSDIKELEKLGMVFIDRQNAKNYMNYVVSLSLGED
ncbi:MAG: hypothetical protein ACTSVL_13245 [Promethearchaeota archaeon]